MGPNMEYCAFENTLNALDQLLDMMEEKDTLDQLKKEASQREQSAIDDMYYKCAEVMAHFERLAENQDEQF